MTEPSTGQTASTALIAATKQLARSGRVHAAFAHDRLSIRERTAVRFVVITTLSGILITLAGVFAAYTPVRIGGLVLGPLLLLAAVGSVAGARLVIDKVRIHGRDAAMRSIDHPHADLTRVRFDRVSDANGVTAKLTVEVRDGDPIAVIDVLVFDVREGATLARQIHALGLGIAAWLRLEFSAHEVDPARPSSSILVAAVDTLGIAFELLAIDS